MAVAASDNNSAIDCTDRALHATVVLKHFVEWLWLVVATSQAIVFGSSVKNPMFSGESALVGGKSVRLKTKMIKALRRSLGTAFPRLLEPIGSNPLIGTDQPVDETQSALDVLVPVKSAINQITYKDKTCLFKVCYDKKVKNSSSVFVPMFLQLKRNHELIPTVFALWRVPDLLRISFVTIPPVSSKLIKPAPADLFFPGVIASNCTRGEEWEQGELCSIFVHRNPFAFAVGRTGQTSYAAAAVACKGVAAVVVHNYLDKIWQMERFQPAGFQETSVVPCLAPEPSPELEAGIEADAEAETGAPDGEISATATAETDLVDNTKEAAAASAASTPADSDNAATLHDDTDPSPPPIPDSKQSTPSTEAAADSEAVACTTDATITPADASALVEEMSLDGTAEEGEDMDNLMLCTLFQALQKVPKGDLPLLANIFMGKYFLPSRPAHTTLKVKQSTWGQFGKFLEAMSHVGVLQLTKLGAKGDMAIAAINPASLEDHEPHVDQAHEDARERQQLQSGSMGTLFGASASSAPGQGKLKIVQLYRPPDNATVLFDTVLERQKVRVWT